MADEHTLVLSNELESLAVLSAFLQNVAVENAWPEELLFEMNLALEEIVVNIIRHAHSDGCRHEIAISVRIERNSIMTAIEDDGKPFDPMAAPPADIGAPLADRPVGGLGLHLVRTVIPELTYSRAGNRNRLVLKKPVGVRT